MLDFFRVGTCIQAAADRAVEKFTGCYIRVSRSTDSAENTIFGDSDGAVLTKHFIAYPKDQNPSKKKRQIETDKPGKSDWDHGFGGSAAGSCVAAGLVVAPVSAGAPQMMRTRPQLS